MTTDPGPNLATTDRVEVAAHQLLRAAESLTPCRPIRHLFDDDVDVGLAYRIQQMNTENALGQGRRLTGRKIGITSEAVMQQLGVDQPDFGSLFADMQYTDGAEIPDGVLLQPRAEAEIAFVLGRDLDLGDHTIADIIEATAHVVPAIEIVDSRIKDWDITIIDTIADNASCGAYVLGTRPVPINDVDLEAVTVTMCIDGVAVSHGIGAACLGNPLHAAKWLADALSIRDVPLRAGQVILTGALGPMRPIGPGNVITADFGDFGTVTTRLANTPAPPPPSKG